MTPALMLTDAPPPPPFEVPKHLPQEIVDLILSELISLHDHDPAYQWTHFRGLTRFHRKQLDGHFLHYWFQKLTLTLYGSPDEYIEYRTEGIPTNTGEVWYKMERFVKKGAVYAGMPSSYSTYYTLLWWQNLVVGKLCSCEDKKRRPNHLILRMGEGILNEGFTGGGLLSDMQLPGLEVDEDSSNLRFDWLAAFSRFFGEEMIMRRPGKELLRRFEEKTAGRRIRRSTPAAIFAGRVSKHKFLRWVYQPLRRELLTAWRDHLSISPFPTLPFDVTRHIPSPLRGNYNPRVRSYENGVDCPRIQQIAFVEESMVFHVPGWEKWDIRGVARLRVTEQEVTAYRRSQPWRTR
jgi:hypothetical protein